MRLNAAVCFALGLLWGFQGGMEQWTMLAVLLGSLWLMTYHVVEAIKRGARP